MDAIRRMPPFTRALCIGAFCTTVPVIYQLVPAHKVVFDLDLVRHRFQAWRLLSTFLYAGPDRPWRGSGWLVIGYLYTMWKMVGTLEDDHYSTRPADLAWQTIVAGSALVMLNVPLRSTILFPQLLIAFCALLSAISARTHISFVRGFLSLPTSFIAPALALLQIVLAGEASAAPPALAGLLVGHVWARLLRRKPTALAAPNLVQKLFPDQPEKQTFSGGESRAAPPRFGARGYADLNTPSNARAGARFTRSNFRDMGCASC